MSFVYPNFLWALLLLLVPIIVHLFHFRRYKKVLFPNVRFLKNVQKQTQSIKKLRNFLVLLARLLALAFLVFAFAQPYIPIDNQEVSQSDEIVGIYIDNSFSMDNDGKQGPLIEEAKSKARELIKSYLPTDRFVVNSNTSIGRLPVNQKDAISLVDNIDIDKTTKPVVDVVDLLNQSLVNNGAAKKHLYLFSDFQGQNSTATSDLSDSSALVTLSPTQPIKNNNISIDTAWIESPVVQLNTPINLVIRISNHGDDALNGGSLALLVNGEKKSVTGFDVAGNNMVSIEVGFTVKTSGWQRIEVSIEDNPIIFDDTYFLSFNVKPSLNVMVVNGVQPNIYLNRLFGPDPYYLLSNQIAGNIDLSALETTDLVILNEVTTLSSGLVAAVSDYVSSGGSILVIPSSVSIQAQLWDLSKVLGLPKIEQKIDLNTKVGTLDLQNPLFDQVFKKIPDNPNYPSIQKYYRLNVESTAHYALMALENRDVFLSESKIGTGHAYVLACPLDDKWSNFPKHGLFVPTVIKMAMNRSVDYPLSNTISNRNIFKAVPESRRLQGELNLIDGETEWMPVINTIGASPFIDAGFEQLQSGNISLQTTDTLLQVVAFNYDRSESKNTFLSNEDVAALFPNIKVDMMDNPATYVTETVSQYRFGKQFWKACIILALIFLAIEILLLRFWPTTVKQ